MMFSVDRGSKDLEHLPEKRFASLGVLERQDIEEWVTDEPRILGEDLLVVTSEFQGFEDTADRLDILALDPEGKLVVVELKRDRADETTDLQAIKYASYCSTITGKELQQDYRTFWNTRRNEEDELTAEAVGERFIDFLGGEETLPTTDEGYADFALDDQPRILLAAGSFGPEITTPVIWLGREYGLEITCVELQVFSRDDEVFVNSRRVLPIPEAEDYMARRRVKEEKQRGSPGTRAKPAINVLLDAGLVDEDDVIIFNEEKLPADADRDFDPNDPFWKAEITGKTGRSNNIRWLEDGTEYSCTGLTKEILHQITGEQHSVNGYPRWCHPDHDMLSLTEIRKEKVGDIDW